MKLLFKITAFLLFPFFASAAGSSEYQIYSGKYELPDGRVLTVSPNEKVLTVRISHGSLLEFADIAGDSRVLAIKNKTAELLNAAIVNDRKKIAKLLQKSPSGMDDYVDSLLDVLEPALDLDPKLNEFNTINVSYRDEDSDYGFGDKSWGWETFTKFAKNDEEVIVRLVWDGVTGHNVHRGTGKQPIAKDVLSFQPRNPSRSWIKVYSPETKNIQMVRELPRKSRKNVIPARFIAYDIDTHNTVGIRFRMNEASGVMRLEIGPLGSDVFTSATKLEKQ